MIDVIKKLTGKNKSEYEQAAAHIVDNCDVLAFKELVDKDDFLFDFVKQNVCKRLQCAINAGNYKNILQFLTFYSQSYDDIIAESLAKYGDEDLIDTMLEKFETGTQNEKAYCAKFFGLVQDTLAIEFLRENSYSEFEPLAQNSAATLAKMGDEQSFKDAIDKLKTNDDFEIYLGAKFLSSYGDKRAVKPLFEALMVSSMAENVASEIFYIETASNLMKTDYDNTLYALCQVMNGLGELLAITQVFDFEIYNVMELLLNSPDSRAAVVLLYAKEKFEELVKDEYIFDEDKNTKNEVMEIKNLLDTSDTLDLQALAANELSETSLFVMFALDLIEPKKQIAQIKTLLTSRNQTLVLKALEVLNRNNLLDETDKNDAFKNVTDENIRAIIKSL